MIAARLSPRALAELSSAIRWVAADSKAAAAELRRAVKEATAQIGEYPGCGQARPELADAPFRFLTIPRHPYVLVYNARRTPPLIVRVVHQARDLRAVLDDL